MKTMIVDSHQHVMLPTSMQVKKMDDLLIQRLAVLHQHLHTF